jgi:hypothetical protein
MGLDMYLNARSYSSKYFNTPNTEILNNLPFQPAVIDDTRGIEVEWTVAYWRKANQIHNWFVDNVQGGEDECRPHYVSKEKLEELRDLCLDVLKTKDATKLPPSEGFFFGSSEIDEWYWEDVEQTADVLTKILDDPNFDKFDFQYRSSW